MAELRDACGDTAFAFSSSMVIRASAAPSTPTVPAGTGAATVSGAAFCDRAMPSAGWPPLSWAAAGGAAIDALPVSSVADGLAADLDGGAGALGGTSFDDGASDDEVFAGGVLAGTAVDDGVFEDVVLDDGVLDDGVFAGTALDDGAFAGTALDDGAFAGTALDDGVLDDGVLDDVGVDAAAVDAALLDTAALPEVVFGAAVVDTAAVDALGDLDVALAFPALADADVDTTALGGAALDATATLPDADVARDTAAFDTTVLGDAVSPADVPVALPTFFGAFFVGLIKPPPSAAATDTRDARPPAGC